MPDYTLKTGIRLNIINSRIKTTEITEEHGVCDIYFAFFSVKLRLLRGENQSMRCPWIPVFEGLTKFEKKSKIIDDLYICGYGIE